jgi:uncharacterized membrane protein YgcG
MNKFVAVYCACSLLVLSLVADEVVKSSSDVAKLPSEVENNIAFNFINIKRSSNNVEEVEEELESELELKRMLNFVTPLMAIFQQRKAKLEVTRPKRSSETNPAEFFTEDLKRGSGRRPMYKSSQTIQPDRSGYGYGDYSSGSSYGGGGGGGSYGCCDKKDVRISLYGLQ